MKTFNWILIVLILSYSRTDGNVSSIYKGKTSLDFNDIIPALTAYFESKYPSASQSINFTTAIVSQNFWENAHNKRCISIENYQAVEDYLSFRWFGLLGGNQVLVNTPCLGTDSLGNRLTAYFENLVCAHLVGMHYVSLAKVWEPKSSDKPSYFIDALPSNVQHLAPSQKREIKPKLKEICKCQGSCHERINSVW